MFGGEKVLYALRLGCSKWNGFKPLFRCREPSSDWAVPCGMAPFNHSPTGKGSRYKGTKSFCLKVRIEDYLQTAQLTVVAFCSFSNMYSGQLVSFQRKVLRSADPKRTSNFGGQITILTHSRTVVEMRTLWQTACS